MSELDKTPKFLRQYEPGFYKLNDSVFVNGNMYRMTRSVYNSKSFASELQTGIWDIVGDGVGGGSLSNGTVSGSILTWSGSAWTEDIEVVSLSNSFSITGKNSFRVFGSGGSLGTDVELQSDSNLGTEIFRTGDGNTTIRNTGKPLAGLTPGDIILSVDNGDDSVINTIQVSIDNIDITSSDLISVFTSRIRVDSQEISIAARTLTPEITIRNAAIGFFGSTAVSQPTIPSPEWTNFETAYPEIADMLSSNQGYGLVSNVS